MRDVGRVGSSFILSATAGLLVAVATGACAPASRDTSGLAESSDVSAPRIELMAGEGSSPGGFAVVDLSDEELAAFQKLPAAKQADAWRVFVVADLADPPPLAGNTAVEGRDVRFTPRYPLEPGMRYRAVWRGGELSSAKGRADNALAAEFDIPQPVRVPTRVTNIYPTSDRLPENQLKFYIHFSAPMGRGDAYRHIHLIGDDGREVDAAFLELGEELWDRNQQRFTLLCDPGRVKRGLKPREELGPVLREGHDYTLVIDRDWRDASGAPLADEVSKSFHVLAPDDGPVDPAAWKIEPPPAGSRDSLVVRFPEPLDHSLLERVLWITAASGEKLSGAIDIDGGETRWRFTPQQPWAAGDYHLVADTTLEDLAANSIGRSFDVDVFAPVGKRIESETVSLPFSVGEE